MKSAQSCISHQLSTAAGDPPHPAMRSHLRVLDGLVTKPGEICRLAFWFVVWSALGASISGAGTGKMSDETLRPQIVVSDSSSGCPSVAGSFVAVLDPGVGMLLLSAAPFPGGHVVGDARGSSMTIRVSNAEWPLDSVGSSRGQAPIWAARYPFQALSGRGCVGFDRQHWSSEGDLVTYLRWLVEDVYLSLPAEVRRRRPDFRLADRQVDLRIHREGFETFELSGREGAALACRYRDSDRLYLFTPFVLDEAAGRVAVKVASTDGQYFDESRKVSLGWVFASVDEPGVVSEPRLSIAVEEVSER